MASKRTLKRRAQRERRRQKLLAWVNDGMRRGVSTAQVDELLKLTYAPGLLDRLNGLNSLPNPFRR